MAGLAYSANLATSGGTAPFVFSLASGSLPPGLTLNPATGAISGTPTTAGTYTFTTQVVDANGSTDTVTCTVTVVAAPLDLACGSCATGQGTVGSAYAATMATTGGQGPFTYSISSGALPAGLTLNPATGAVTGTPTTAGTFTFTTKVVDARGSSDTATCAIKVVASPITLNCGTCGSNRAYVGAPHSSTLSVIGAKAPYTFSIAAGALPPGLTLNSSTGVISGTPTTAGSYTFTTKVVDANGNSDTATCTVVVSYTSVNLDCGACGTTGGKVGSAYSASLAVSGGKAPYSYSIYSGTLPPGLTLNASTGVISGTPTAAGTYTFTSKVRDANGSTDTATCTIVIAGSILNLDCGACGTSKATVGTPYSSTLAVTGGRSPFTYSLYSGSLPPGLSLNATTGVISGTPTATGTYTFTTKVRDANGNTDTATCTLIVAASPVDLQCGSCGSSSAGVGAAYSSSLTAVGASGTVTFSLVSGSLPPGLTLNSATGVISGTPTTAGSYTFTSKVVDGRGNTDTATCTIVVAASTVDIQCGACSAGKATIGTAYSAALAATGGTGPYTFSISAGALPAGLTLNASTGVISGTPTTAASYTFTSMVVDAKGKSDTVTCTITVIAPPVTLNCGPCSGSKGTVGVAYAANMTVTGGIGPFTYSLATGSVLPAGLSLNSATGAITGTPTTPGTYTFTAKVVDAKGSTDTDICTIVIAAPAVDLQCGTCGASKATVNVAYSVTLPVTGGKAPYTFSIVSGSLPTGVTLNSTTGVVSGKPTVAGSYTFTTKVVDANGSSDLASCSIVVAGSITAGAFTTYTQGGWGASPSGNNPGALLQAKFATVYPGGSVSIGGGYKLTFTGAAKIAAFLPQGGTASRLTSSSTDATGSAAGVLAGQVLALQLNVDFSNKGVTAGGLAALTVKSGALGGYTVAQVLATANAVLGGNLSALPAGVSICDLNGVLDSINNNFDNGTSNDGYLK